MAYYTVAHLLQGGVLDGSVTGPANILPEQLSQKVWDYILLGAPFPDDTTIPEHVLQKLRNEFRYWYPVDLRVSGKDLIPNHLTFFLYNHTAIFTPDKWPKGIKANGHILLNNLKMSKQTGNFQTMREAIENYSADGMRLALADAGDGLDDANFTNGSAHGAILRLSAQIDQCMKLVDTNQDNNNNSFKFNPIGQSEDPSFSFADLVFMSEINKAIRLTDEHYQGMKYQKALQTGFWELQLARDNYRKFVGETNQNYELSRHFIEVQALLISPIAPHVAEHLWSLLGKEGLIVNAKWPEAGPVSEDLLMRSNYLQHDLVEDNFRAKHKYVEKKFGPSRKPSSAIIFTSTSSPAWKTRALELLNPLYQASKQLPSEEEVRKLCGGDEIIRSKLTDALSFTAQLRARVAKGPVEKLKDQNEEVEEDKLLREHAGYVSRSLGLKRVDVESDTSSSDSHRQLLASSQKQPMLGSPLIIFFDESGSPLL